MARQGAPPIHSPKEFLETINSPEPLAVAVRGHQCIEAVLNLAISEALPEPHTMEVRRLEFGLKVDLGTALGIIPADCRPAYVRVNRIRNLFAHDPRAEFSEDDARDLYNCLSPYFRYLLGRAMGELGPPLEGFRQCIAVLTVFLEGRVTRMRDDKVRDRVLHEMVIETLGPPDSPAARARECYSVERMARIEEAVHRERQVREAAGEP